MKANRGHQRPARGLMRIGDEPGPPRRPPAAAWYCSGLHRAHGARVRRSPRSGQPKGPELDDLCAAARAGGTIVGRAESAIWLLPRRRITTQGALQEHGNVAWITSEHAID